MRHIRMCLLLLLLTTQFTEPRIQRSSAVYPCSVSVFSKGIRLKETSLQRLNKVYNPPRCI